jgi:hypothetical protein
MYGPAVRRKRFLPIWRLASIQQPSLPPLAPKQTWHTSIPRLLTEAGFTMRYTMPIHHDDVAPAKAPPPLWATTRRAR